MQRMTQSMANEPAQSKVNVVPNFQKIRYAVADAVAFITLNRPKVHNALDPKVYAELTQARTLALADPAVNAILLAGEGRSFCSGWDLSQSVDEPEPTQWGRWLGLQDRH